MVCISICPKLSSILFPLDTKMSVRRRKKYFFDFFLFKKKEFSSF